MSYRIARHRIVRCRQCNNPFRTFLSTLKNRKGIFCSNICKSQWLQLRRSTKQCLWCENLFFNKNARSKFCSKKCASISLKFRPSKGEFIELECGYCHVRFTRIKHKIDKETVTHYCNQCRSLKRRLATGNGDVTNTRTQCQTKFIIEYKSQKRKFCSRSCSSRHMQLNRKHGSSISRMEVWMQNKLQDEFPATLPCDRTGI